MDLTGIGSLGMYAKNLRLKTHWDLKKNSGDVNSHTSLNDMMKKTQTAAFYQSQVDEANGQGADRMQKIMDKLNTGKKLTREEKQYLQAKDPKLYMMVQAADEEQKDYEREIRKCRTKEEVQRVKTAHMTASLARIKSVEHNSAISEEKKRELYAVENYRAARLDASTKAFVKRGEYAKLPTDAEAKKAEQEDKEEAVTAEEKETRKETEETAGKETREPARKEAREPTESIEAKKVRRAKARAAYAAYSVTEPEADNEIEVWA